MDPYGKNYEGSGPPPYPVGNQYPAAQTYPAPQVHTVQPQVIYSTVVNNPVYGGIPLNTICPFCRAEIVTGIRYETGLLTWLLCGGIFLVGCVFGCCLIPFCVDGCKNVVHICPNCDKKVGEFRRL